ncbi:MAG: dolichyl-phosphate beta-glucosyltransferase [Candidatus Liptonbacteria bacterium]
MDKPLLSIIIPAYNEADRIPHTILDTDKRLSEKDWSYEILVLNDGSKDATADIVRKMAKTIKNLNLVDNIENQGKGGVVKQGMLLARGKYRLFTDADNSTTVDQFEKMLPYFEEGYDVVIGSRSIPGSTLEPAQPFYRRILGWGSNLIIQAVNVPGIWDTQCGFKAVTEEAAEAIFNKTKIAGWGFDIEMLALARALGYRIKEVPVHWVNDVSSHVKLSAYLKVFVENVKIRWWIMRGSYAGLTPTAH